MSRSHSRSTPYLQSALPKSSAQRVSPSRARRASSGRSTRNGRTELPRDRLAQDELLDLRARHRPLVDEAHVTRDLVARDLSAAEVDDLLLGGRRAALELQERGDDLAVLGVRRGHDLGDAHRRMADEVTLDLERGHVLAPDLEHVLQAPRVGQAAVFVELGQILRVEVALVVETRRGQLRVLVVALEQRVALEAQLADDAGGHALAGLGV